MFSFRRLFRSFKYALKGFLIVFREEQSFQIQLIVAVAVLGLIFYFNLRVWEIALLLLLIMTVLVLELINSIFERLVDVLKPRLSNYVREIKDIMAATVLLASIVSTVIGVIIFWPYFESLI
jgi:diacylglycerol kinase